MVQQQGYISESSRSPHVCLQPSSREQIEFTVISVSNFESEAVSGELTEDSQETDSPNGLPSMNSVYSLQVVTAAK